MSTTPSIAGRWALVDARIDETRLPSHAVFFEFHDAREGETGPSGVVVNRNGGPDFPLQNLTVDAATLRLQMSPPKAHTGDPLPWLVMTAEGDGRFVGGWDSKPMAHIRLKLIRLPE